MPHTDDEPPEVPHPPRWVVVPDPAWDAADLRDDGHLTVELTWFPDALAGRLEQLVASPELAGELQQAGITGFTTTTAKGVFTEDALEGEPGSEPPLVRLRVAENRAADLSYRPGSGLLASRRALDLLKKRCSRMEISEDRRLV